MPTAIVDEPTHRRIAEVIRTLAQQWIDAGNAPSLYEINNGLCEDFAMDVIAQFRGEGPRLSMYWADNFSRDGEGEDWDADLLLEHWPTCTPTHGLDWSEVQGEFPRHAWIVLDGRHYDAECPEGVDNFFELPLIRRGMELFAARKASACPA